MICLASQYCKLHQIARGHPLLRLIQMAIGVRSLHQWSLNDVQRNLQLLSGLGGKMPRGGSCLTGPEELRWNLMPISTWVSCIVCGKLEVRNKSKPGGSYGVPSASSSVSPSMNLSMPLMSLAGKDGTPALKRGQCILRTCRESKNCFNCVFFWFQWYEQSLIFMYGGIRDISKALGVTKSLGMLGHWASRTRSGVAQ